MHACGGFENVFAASGSDGVHDDDVGAKAFFVEFRHEEACVGGVEFGVFYMVECGIFLSVLDGFPDDFAADDAACFFRKAEGNGACAAVGVDDGFPAFEVSGIQGFLVEDFCLGLVDLEEGKWRYFEGNAAEGCGEGLSSPDVVDFRS